MSVRRARRAWHLCAAYDAAMIGKRPRIFRVGHNWLWWGKDGRTAAERIGLASGEVRADHILGFEVRTLVERLAQKRCPEAARKRTARCLYDGAVPPLWVETGPLSSTNDELRAERVQGQRSCFVVGNAYSLVRLP
jgi:hypothetical protein